MHFYGARWKPRTYTYVDMVATASILSTVKSWRMFAHRVDRLRKAERRNAFSQRMLRRNTVLWKLRTFRITHWFTCASWVGTQLTLRRRKGMPAMTNFYERRCCFTARSAQGSRELKYRAYHKKCLFEILKKTSRSVTIELYHLKSVWIVRPRERDTWISFSLMSSNE